MDLDDDRFRSVPEVVLRDARNQWEPGSETWVVTMDGSTGLLATTPGGMVWRFTSSTWTMPWTALDDVVFSGEREVTVLRAGGESYRFAFADLEERARFMQVRRAVSVAPHSLPLPDRRDTRSLLATLMVIGVLAALIGGVVLAAAEEVWLAMLLLVPAQICVGVSVIGWGVMLGIRAARE